MVKIYANKAKSFIESLENSNILAVLIYGPDSGQVSNFAKDISNKITPDLNDPFMVANIDNDSLDSESTIIYDEMMSISFGVGKRLVLAKNIEGAEAAKVVVRSIEDLPRNCADTSFLLVTAGDLQPTSPLRKLFEGKSSNLVAIPCYKEDARDLSIKIFNLVQAKGLHIEPEAANFLSQSCQGDSKIVENEIEKLSLYIEDGVTKITFDDVVLSTGNTTESSMQDVCDAVFSGNRAMIEKTYKKALESGIAPIAIFRSLQRYLEKLHQAFYYVNEGNTIDLAIKYIKPPIFFKQVQVFKAHLGKIINSGEESLFKRYSYILNAEFETKQSNSEPEIITSRLLQKLAS